MVGLGCDAPSGQSLFTDFVKIQKQLFSQIGLPFRVVEIPADDLGQYKYFRFYKFEKYFIETVFELYRKHQNMIEWDILRG